MLGGIDEGWSLDLDGIDAAFAAGAKAMVLCNPHNPIGLVPDASQLASLAEIAARHGVTIVSDEVHGPLVQPGVDLHAVPHGIRRGARARRRHHLRDRSRSTSPA